MFCFRGMSQIVGVLGSRKLRVKDFGVVGFRVQGLGCRFEAA